MNQALPLETEIIKETASYSVIRYKNDGRLALIFAKSPSKKLKDCLDLCDILYLLPSDESRNLAYTNDLVEEWEKLRCFNKRTAFCLFLKTLEIDWKIAEKDITDKYISPLIDATLARYEAIKELITVGFSALKKCLPECSTTPEQLLHEIIREEANLSFLNKITHDFIQYEPSRLNKVYTELAKKDPSAIDWEKVNKNKPIHTEASESDRLFSQVLHCLRDKPNLIPRNLRATVKNRLIVYGESERYRNEVLAGMTAGRSTEENFVNASRTAEGNLVSTVTWRNGKVTYSSYGRSKKPEA